MQSDQMNLADCSGPRQHKYRTRGESKHVGHEDADHDRSRSIVLHCLSITAVKLLCMCAGTSCVSRLHRCARREYGDAAAVHNEKILWIDMIDAQGLL